jgi:hypothetical protein
MVLTTLTANYNRVSLVDIELHGKERPQRIARWEERRQRSKSFRSTHIQAGDIAEGWIAKTGLKELGSHSSRMTTFACPAIAVAVGIINTKAPINELKAGLRRELSRPLLSLLHHACAPVVNSSLAVSAQAGRLLKDAMIFMVSLTAPI